MGKPNLVSHIADDFVLWLEIGQQSGWGGEVTCGMHDGPEMTESEYDSLDEYDDPCLPIVRIWIPEDMK